MRYQLVFNNSGDSIHLDSVNTDVLEYFVEQLNNSSNNNFNIEPTFGNRLRHSLQGLDNQIEVINTWISELLDGTISTCAVEDYLNQQVLNKLHSDWVKSQSLLYNIQEKRQRYNSAQTELIYSLFPDEIPTPELSSVIKNLGYTAVYDRLNLLIHQIEDILGKVIQCTPSQWTAFDNPFSKSILTNNVGNFAIGFKHLGRTLYNKFSTFDLDLSYNDENNFDQLIACVDIHLAIPQTIELSKEYIAWCNSLNKVPSGKNLIIGNIPDLAQRLTEYRQIIFRNSLQNNSFTVQLNKG
jgi:hypothetical protein